MRRDTAQAFIVNQLPERLGGDRRWPLSKGYRRALCAGLLLFLFNPALAGQPTPMPTATLPVLPPPHVLFPTVYDANDCIIMDLEGHVSCPTDFRSPKRRARDAAAPPKTDVPLRGYLGPRFTTDLSRNEIAVLPDTVDVSSGNLWQAAGLLRNERQSVVTDIQVIARLYDAHDQLITSVATESPVKNVRPGEPAPFALSSTVPRNRIHRVTWSVTAKEAPAPAKGRDYFIRTYWSKPYGNRERSTYYFGADPAQPPYPFLDFGQVQNLGADPVDNPSVVGAWVDHGGRCIRVITGQVIAPDGSRLTHLAPGSRADFVFEDEDPAAAAIRDTDRFVVWGTVL